MRWILRILLVCVIAIALVGLFRNNWLQRAKALVAARESSERDERTDAGDQPQQDQTPSPDSAPIDDDAQDTRDLKHPLTRSLADALESQKDRLGDDGEELQQSLLEADELLWNAKQQNREAIRQANRQVRLPGRSPNVVLIVCQGLTTSDIGCYQQAPLSLTPYVDRIAAEGLRLTAFRSNGLAADQWSLLTGRTWSGSEQPKLQSRDATLSRVLWQAGYTTAVIGDCSWWGVAVDEFDWDAWFGFRTAAESSEAYPESVWSNGRRIGLTANADGKQGLLVQRLFVDEACAYLQRHRRGRPFLLCLSLALRQSQNDHAAALAEMDERVKAIVGQLDQTGIARNTLLLVVGLAAGDNASPELPALVRWPGRIPAGSVYPEKVRCEDLLPTLAESVQALRRPRNVHGKSLFGVWQSIQPESTPKESG